jgi:hypothetical protein
MQYGKKNIVFRSSMQTECTCESFERGDGTPFQTIIIIQAYLIVFINSIIFIQNIYGKQVTQSQTIYPPKGQAKTVKQKFIQKCILNKSIHGNKLVR